MRASRRRVIYVMKHPVAFALRVLRAFRANQALLLSGAVAYYTLLSIVPLLTLILIALSAITDQGALLATVGRYLEWLIPGQSSAVVTQLAVFRKHTEQPSFGVSHLVPVRLVEYPELLVVSNYTQPPGICR